MIESEMRATILKVERILNKMKGAQRGIASMLRIDQKLWNGNDRNILRETIDTYYDDYLDTLDGILGMEEEATDLTDAQKVEVLDNFNLWLEGKVPKIDKDQNQINTYVETSMPVLIPMEAGRKFLLSEFQKKDD